MCFNETVSLIVFLGAMTTGLKLYNNNGVITKKAKLLSEEGIFHFL